MPRSHPSVRIANNDSKLSPAKWTARNVCLKRGRCSKTMNVNPAGISLDPWYTPQPVCFRICSFHIHTRPKNGKSGSDPDVFNEFITLLQWKQSFDSLGGRSSPGRPRPSSNFGSIHLNESCVFSEVYMRRETQINFGEIFGRKQVVSLIFSTVKCLVGTAVYKRCNEL